MRFERTYPYPPDAVWSALTDARAIRQWWVDTDFRPEPGVRFFFQDTPQGSWDGRVTGEVLEVDPGRRVRFSWSGGGHETEVTWTVEPAPGGSRVTVEQVGFKGIGGLFLSIMLRFGWRSLLAKTLPETARHLTDRGWDVPLPSVAKAGRVG